MKPFSASLVLLGLGVGASAGIANSFDRRTPYAGGGWALLTFGTCPSPYQTLNYPGMPGNVCCPSGFEQQQSRANAAGRVCCPSGSACLDALESAPFCADSTWTLWNATDTSNTGSGFFYCLPGQVGTENFQCDSGSSNIAATLSASMIGKPVPTGAAGATISVSGGSASGSTITSGAAAATGQSSTTTSKDGGVGGLVSSALSKVTGKSDSSKGPPPADFRGLLIAGGCFLSFFAGALALPLLVM